MINFNIKLKNIKTNNIGILNDVNNDILNVLTNDTYIDWDRNDCKIISCSINIEGKCNKKLIISYKHLNYILQFLYIDNNNQYKFKCISEDKSKIISLPLNFLKMNEVHVIKTI